MQVGPAGFTGSRDARRWDKAGREKPLQCSPSPCAGLSLPLTAVSQFLVWMKQSGHGTDPKCAWDIGPQLSYGLPARRGDVPVKLPPSLVPTAVVFWQLKKVFHSRSFHPKNRCRAWIVKARVGDAATQLFLSTLSHRASRNPGLGELVQQGTKSDPCNSKQGQRPGLSVRPTATPGCTTPGVPGGRGREGGMVRKQRHPLH